MSRVSGEAWACTADGRLSGSRKASPSSQLVLIGGTLLVGLVLLLAAQSMALAVALESRNGEVALVFGSLQWEIFPLLMAPAVLVTWSTAWASARQGHEPHDECHRRGCQEGGRQAEGRLVDAQLRQDPLARLSWIKALAADLGEAGAGNGEYGASCAAERAERLESAARGIRLPRFHRLCRHPSALRRSSIPRSVAGPKRARTHPGYGLGLLVSGVPERAERLLDSAAVRTHRAAVMPLSCRRQGWPWSTSVTRGLPRRPPGRGLRLAGQHRLRA